MAVRYKYTVITRFKDQGINYQPFENHRNPTEAAEAACKCIKVIEKSGVMIVGSLPYLPEDVESIEVRVDEMHTLSSYDFMDIYESSSRF